MPEVNYVDLDGMIVCLADGETAPITNMFDIWGDECPEDEAVCVVAGPFSMGWLSIDLYEIPPRVLH